MTIHDELRPLCAAAPRDVNIYDDVGWRCPEAEAFYARIHETLPALLDENARLREVSASARALLRTIDRESGYGSGMIAIVLRELDLVLKAAPARRGGNDDRP
jgi:hypothetical protein